MNTEEISLSLWQGEMHLTITVPKVVAERAAQIQERNPEEDWDEKGLTLINKAYDELKAEGITFPKK